MVEHEDITPNDLNDWLQEKKRKEQQKTRSEKWKAELQEKLPKMLKSQEREHDWSSEESLPNSEGRQKVDILGKARAQDHYVFIELEAERMTCVRNVIKAWMYVAEKTDSKPVLFIHVFSPSFNVSQKRRGREESIFVGERAQNDTSGKLTYRHIESDRWPTETEYATVIDSLVQKFVGFLAEYSRSSR